ncbi:mitochondrial ribosomal protein L32, precursor [Cyanidioschyzon merolae strain 10D]|uniref:Large ribosomal subunit protein bL32m n=1 Tax=Cyanidioschyzon merolae (strain NIES-3377 / 10D) TaxID=280699 RepID=M1V9V7_CYAM1|nr:mitochondrial ribosomal protein L32, precursor [Cyanidioschyzon merolae strain 10D]BAM78777.1 mitochondrial ribosomal protein L32, precursor [Cyanidioschyzon merolae strain 10D]|eukprot:XP_005535063.1 mitochondrial ribosomal protein L32, precursor [Cyanidioschyzon merolae strain 10D]
MRSLISSALTCFSAPCLETFRLGALLAWERLTNVVVGSVCSERPFLQHVLLAVPKKKTSHSRKRMRASGKGLRPYPNVQQCPNCGTFHLPHRLCPGCGFAPVKRSNRLAGLEQVAFQMNPC